MDCLRRHTYMLRICLTVKAITKSRTRLFSPCFKIPSMENRNLKIPPIHHNMHPVSQRGSHYHIPTSTGTILYRLVCFLFDNKEECRANK
jgi:hypothetical protein